jgi:hypothetical protein
LLGLHGWAAHLGAAHPCGCGSDRGDRAERLRVEHAERGTHLREDREQVADEEVRVLVADHDVDALALPQDGLAEVTDEGGVLRDALRDNDLEAPQLVELLDRRGRVANEVLARGVLRGEEAGRVPVVRVDHQRRSGDGDP